MANRKAGTMVCAALIVSALAGCATLSGSNRQDIKAKAGRGEIYLAVGNGPVPALPEKTTRTMRLTALGERPAVRYKGASPEARNQASGVWVPIAEHNQKGETLGIVISPIASHTVLRDALEQALETAGYTVRVVRKLPTNVARGIDVSRISFEAEQTEGLVSTEGDCTVKVSLNFWRNNARVKRGEYTAHYSDFALSDRDGLPETLILGSLQKLMKQAVPDIIREMGRPS